MPTLPLQVSLQTKNRKFKSIDGNFAMQSTWKVPGLWSASKKSISYNTTGYTNHANGGLICPISECGLLYGWRKKAKWQLKYTGVKTKMENVHCHNHWYNHDKGCNNLSPKVTKFSLSALLVLLYINWNKKQIIYKSVAINVILLKVPRYTDSFSSFF